MINSEQEGYSEEPKNTDEKMRNAVRAIVEAALQTREGTPLLIEVLGLTEEKPVSEWTGEDYGKVLAALPSPAASDSAADAQEIRGKVVEYALEKGFSQEDLVQPDPHFINEKAETEAKESPFAHLQYHIERSLESLANRGDKAAFLAKVTQWRTYYESILSQSDLINEPELPALQAVEHIFSFIEKVGREQGVVVKNPKEEMLTTALKEEFKINLTPDTPEDLSQQAESPESPQSDVLLEVKAYLGNLAEVLGKEPPTDVLISMIGELLDYKKTFDPKDDGLAFDAREYLAIIAHIEKAAGYMLTRVFSAAHTMNLADQSKVLAKLLEAGILASANVDSVPSMTPVNEWQGKLGTGDFIDKLPVEELENPSLVVETKMFINAIAKRLAKDASLESLQQEFLNLQKTTEDIQRTLPFNGEQREELEALIVQAKKALAEEIIAAASANPEIDPETFAELISWIRETGSATQAPEGSTGMAWTDAAGNLDVDLFGAVDEPLRILAENINKNKANREALVALESIFREQLAEALRKGVMGSDLQDKFDALRDKIHEELGRIDAANPDVNRVTPQFLANLNTALDDDIILWPYEALINYYNKLQDDNLATGGSVEHTTVLNKLVERIKAFEQARQRRPENEAVSDADRELYGGAIDASIEARFRRFKAATMGGFDVDRATERELRLYYADILRWTKVVSDNARQKGGGLDMDKDRFRKYKEILAQGEELDLHEIGANMAYLSNQDAAGAVGGRLNRYFVKIEEIDGKMEYIHIQRTGVMDPREILGEHGVMRNEVTMPDTLAETMQLIEAMYPKWRGKFINSRGEFNSLNFTKFVRQRLEDQAKENPRGDISMDRILVKTLYSDIPLSQILNLEKFLKERELIIRGSDADLDTIAAGWGNLTDPNEETNPNAFTLGRARQLYYEAEFMCLFHTFMNKAKGLPPTEEEWVKFLMELHGRNALLPNIFLIFGLPGTEKGQAEMQKFWNGDGDGVVGRMVRETMRAYSRYGEFCARWNIPYGEADKHGNRKVRAKEFMENDYYRYMEPDGASTFLLSLVEQSLGEHKGAKALYQTFTKDLLTQMKNLHVARIPTGTAGDTQREHLDQIQNKYLDRLRKLQEDESLNGVPVSFDSNSFLSDFEQEVAVSIWDERDFTSAEQAVLSKAARDKVKGLMRANLRSGYLEKVKKVQVYKGAKVSSGKINLENQEVPLNQIDPTAGEDEKVTLGKLLELFSPEDHIDFFDRKMSSNAEMKKFASSTDFKKNFASLEKLGVGFMMGMAGYTKRTELNYFQSKRFNETNAKIIDQSIKNGLQKAFELNDIDANYAFRMGYNISWCFEVMQALDKVINGGNATGFYYPARGNMEYRVRQSESRKTGGNPLSLDIIRDLFAPFDQMAMIRLAGEKDPHLTLADIVDGGQGDQYEVRANREVGNADDYTKGHHQEEQIVTNQLRKAAAMLELLIKDPFDIDKICYIHPYYGTIQIDQNAAVEFIDKFWGSDRYGIGKHAEIDYSQLVWDGEKNITRLESMVGKDAIRLGIAYHIEQLKGKKNPKTGKKYTTAEMTAEAMKKLYKDPSIGVFCAVVGAGLAARVKMEAGNRPLTSSQIEELQTVLAQYFSKMDAPQAGGPHHGNRYHKGDPLLTEHLFSLMMKQFGSLDLTQMKLKEGGISIIVGLLAGVVGALQAAMKDSLKV